MDAYITGPTLATEIEQIRKAQVTKRPILLMEGDSDRRTIRNILHTYVDIVPGNGKPTTLDALNHLNLPAIEDWFTAIIDADFDRILGTQYSSLVLITDSHDMDCEHIRSPALNKVVQELCSDQKCIKVFGLSINERLDELSASIRSTLLSLAMPIGLLRLVSLTRDLGLKFKELDHGKILQSDKIAVDLTLLCNRTMATGAKKHVAAHELLSEINKLAEANHDPWQLCQGHDMCKLFSLVVRKYLGAGNLSATETERALRLAYESAYFWRSDLGKRLRDRLRLMGVEIILHN